jgi:hypothetical protein
MSYIELFYTPTICGKGPTWQATSKLFYMQNPPPWKYSLLIKLISKLLNIQSILIPKGSRVLFRSTIWNSCTNGSHRSWILYSIYMVRFTNAITNIFYTIWNLKFKIPCKFDYKQNINLFGTRFVEMGLKRNTLDVVIFWDFFVA